jgi:hypothetical protein
LAIRQTMTELRSLACFTGDLRLRGGGDGVSCSR